MRVSVRSSTVSRLAAAVAALWLYGTGPASAGGGGEDAGTFQPFLNQFCDLLAMTPCPQMPTLTQIVLEISALVNTPPDLVRSPMGPGAQGLGGLGICTVAGNSGFGLPPCSDSAVNAVNPPAL